MSVGSTTSRYLSEALSCNRRMVFFAEFYNLINFEAFCLKIHKMVFVTIEYLSLNAPVIIDEIRIVEIHTPSLTLWRKTAKKQYFSIFWQEGAERMVFNTVLVAVDIFCIQI